MMKLLPADFGGEGDQAVVHPYDFRPAQVRGLSLPSLVEKKGSKIRLR